MSSSFLNDRVSHSIIFLIHSLPPLVFGTTCFVNNLTSSQDKLLNWLFKCAFMGHHRSQKKGTDVSILIMIHILCLLASLSLSLLYTIHINDYICSYFITLPIFLHHYQMTWDAYLVPLQVYGTYLRWIMI